MLENNFEELFEVKEGKTIEDIIERYKPYWFWFLLSCFISVLCAIVYLKIATPTYQAIASIIIKDEDSSYSSDSFYSDMGFFSPMSGNSIINELSLLRSKRLMQNTIESLGLQITYINPEPLKKPELYKNSPFVLEVLTIDEKLLNEAINYGENYFELNGFNSETVNIIDLATGNSKIIPLNSVVNLDFITFKIKRNINVELDETSIEKILIEINSLERTASRYWSGLGVDLIDEDATVVQLAIIDPVIQRAKDILNQLVVEYNKESIDDKKIIAENTAAFIDERLKIINKELDSVEIGKEQFKEFNRLTNIDAESQINLQNESEYSRKRQEVGTQLGLVNEMIRYMNDDQLGLLPVNLGIEDGNINNMINEFNSLVLSRDRILNGATLTNPIVIKLTNQIEQLKNSIKSSLKTKKTNLNISIQDLDKQSGIIGSQISKVPYQERLFRGIERQQNVKEALYLFLLQKREENSLSLAATAPKAKIVDKAYSSGGKVFPNSKKILLGSLFFGLLIPFVFINVRSILNNKIESKEELEKITKKITVLGELPHLTKSEEYLVKENDRSILSESIRILISNLYYKLGDLKKDSSKTIFITSSLKGEGKTFTSLNLATMLAVNEKKVALIGADLRNPQIHKFDRSIENNIGLSNYLANNDVDLEDLLLDTKLNKNLKILPSGPVPPNPAELLGKSRISVLFKELNEKFDYVIVDTPPSMILADTFLINKYADLTLYMVRAGETEKRVLRKFIETKTDKRFSNIGIVLNDVKIKNFGFGKYGYKYGSEA